MIGADEVPARVMTTLWTYVPPRTYACSPGLRVFSAFWIVRHGEDSEPGLESEPVVAT